MSTRLRKIADSGMSPGAKMKAFSDMLGGIAKAVLHTGCYYYEDGSFHESDPMGLMCDAQDLLDSGDERQIWQVLQNQLFYYDRKQQDAVREFEAAKADLTHRTRYAVDHGTVPPDRSELRSLKALKRKVEELTLKYNEVFDKLNPPAKPVSQEIIAIEEKNRKKGLEIESKLKSIEV